MRELIFPFFCGLWSGIIITGIAIIIYFKKKQGDGEE